MPGPIGYAPSPGGYVAHQVVGATGPWLVLLPTTTASLASWWDLPQARDVLHRLAAHCRVVLLDRRGTGSSDPLAAEERADAVAHAQDVVAVLAHLHAEDVVVVGESYDGGPTALHVAADAGDRVARVVVLNLALSPVTADLELGRDQLVEAILWGGDELPADLELLPSVADDPAYAAWAERAGRATGPAMARSLWEAMLEYDLTDVLPRVEVPVTVVATGHWSAPDDGARELADALPDATVVEVPRDDTLLFVGDNARLVGELLFAATGERRPVPSTRELIAVVFTDLVGSTARAASVGDDRWRQQLDLHDRVVEEVVVGHGGRVVKQTGDGALSTFPLPSRAVAAATELVERLGAMDLPSRAGVHVGEVERRGDDIGGVAVHVAARVADHAEAGAVLVTGAVRATTIGSGLTFGDPVEVELRGVPGLWALARV